MASVQEENRLSSYRKLLIQLSLDLSSKDIEMLKFAAVDFIPRGRIESISSGLQFFDVLEQDARIGPRNLSLLQEMFHSINRMDLEHRIQTYLPTSVAVEIDGINRDDMVTDGGGDNKEDEPANPQTSDTNQAEGGQRARGAPSVQLARTQLLTNESAPGAPVTFRAINTGQGAPQISQCLAVLYSDTSQPSASDGSSLGPAPAIVPAPAPVPVAAPAPALRPAAPSHEALCVQPCGASLALPGSGRVQHDNSTGPPPVRYVNFLACEGYTVEIIGGKHFKTPEGEFVEMKSGTQYKIHAKNTHAYGCHLDISIDGYDVGGWAIDGREELSIERPVYEAKKFTFYRVKTAPKEAGIESGRSENGVVKCVFTPEAFLNIPVIISDLPQPLDVDMPPSATVGDLKREVQRQLNKRNDPDQVLVMDQKVLFNSTRLRKLLQSTSGNLRLIDVEMEITVNTSSNKTFPVKIHPGKAKVHDLMDQIEGELNVPSNDQKVYLGTALLSDAPRRGLPRELICSSQPTIDVIVPEYIHVTVEDHKGVSHDIKIDKEKSLIQLMVEIPPCRNLQENEEVMFFFNGKELCPSKDAGALTSLGLCTGSKLELKVKVPFIEIFVDAWFSYQTISIKCSLQETFKDLLKKVDMLKVTKGVLGKDTFVMKDKVFDPEQDIGPLQDYGVTHRSVLQMKKAAPPPIVPDEDSQKPVGAESSKSAKENERLARLAALDELKLGGSLDQASVPFGEGKETKSLLGRLKEKFHRKDPKVTKKKESKNVLMSADSFTPRRRQPPLCRDRPVERARSPDLEKYVRYGASLTTLLKGRLAVGTAGDDDDEWSPAPPPPPPLKSLGGPAERARFSDLEKCTPRAASSPQIKGWNEKKTPNDVPPPPPPPPSVGGGLPSRRPQTFSYDDWDEEWEPSGHDMGHVTEPDPAWRAGGTTLQGYSTQQFMTAEPIKVDPTRKIELVLRLVAREDEKDLVFPKGEFKPLSTLYPPAVPE